MHNVFSQTEKEMYDYLSFDTVFSIAKTVRPASIVVAKDGNSAYFINYDRSQKTDTFILYKFDVYTYKLDSFSLSIPDLPAKMTQSIYKNFSFITKKGKLFAVAFDKFVFLFEEHNGQYVFSKMLGIPLSVKRAELLDEHTLLLYDCYYSHTPSVYLALYDIDKEQIVRKIEPDYFHPLFEFFNSNQMFTVCGSRIVFAHRGKYASVFYDFHLDSIGYFSKKDTNWKVLSDKTIKTIKHKYHIYDAPSIGRVMENLDHTICQQRAIHSIDTSKVICFYQPPYESGKAPAIYVDIWEKQGDDFVLKDNAIRDKFRIKENKDGVIDCHSFGLAFVTNPKYLFFKDKVILIKRQEGTPINPIGLSKEDYFKQANDYLLDHDYIVEISVFSHSF